MRNQPESGLEGSGTRAMEANEAALTAAKAELEALTARAASGEIVDREVEEVLDRIRDLKEDQGRISSAGV
ncbi:MAG TPA: hypothetical protein VD998_02805 [Verrucomicrobiae bacterium]|nr:hypothetical protein [Verrucomicrobiae bacterium]